jgi:dTDP-glucose 4,6-dehydratase
MKLLLTGGCGFIGHHFVQHIMKNTDWEIIILDKLTYACKGVERLRDMNYLNDKRIKLFTYDLVNKISEGIVKEIGDVDIIVHMAAETHVDNSITEPVQVIQNNVMSTVNLLEYARTLKTLKVFFYFSTDEVFGPALGDTLYKEWDRHCPTNPYSASKSASENICIAYENTYKVPIMIVNVMNVIGERQLVEKFVPLVMRKVLNGETVYIHSDKNGTPGSRFYIHARNVADAVLFLLKNGKIGDKYNISGEKEMDNLQMAKKIAEIIGKPLKYEVIDFHSSRPGHDLRYGLDGSKLFKLGWKPKIDFEESLKKTIEWTLKEDNLKWLE